MGLQVRYESIIRLLETILHHSAPYSCQASFLKSTYERVQNTGWKTEHGPGRVKAGRVWANDNKKCGGRGLYTGLLSQRYVSKRIGPCCSCLIDGEHV